MHHPLLNLAAYNNETFLEAVETFLTNPSSVLSCDSAVLVDVAGADNLKLMLQGASSDNKPTLAEAFQIGQGKDGFEIAGRMFSHLAKSNSYHSSLAANLRLANSFTVHRPVLGFSDDEFSLFRTLASVVSSRQMPAREWENCIARLTWNNGNCYLEPFPGIADDQRMSSGRNALTTFLKQYLPDHPTVLADLARTASRCAARQVVNGASSTAQQKVAHQDFTRSGERWLTCADLQNNKVFSLNQTPASVMVGYEPASGQALYFNGHESLITIGGAGSGKSQCQVIPNLLTFPGSAIVLDVKGELWETTAGYRQTHFGPVYKFQPTSKTGETHRYNPFDFISTDPGQASEDCAIFSHQVVVENPNAKEPYWENRARDYLWAYALMVALKNPPEHRTIAGLAEVYNWPQATHPNSDIVQLAKSMVRNGDRHGITDLKSAGRSIINGLGDQRLDSTFDNARTQLAPFTRSPNLTYSLATSDWRPEQLRTRPGTTIYICMTVDELKAYGAVVRVMLAQHANILLRHRANPQDPPITLFLDELPQLGNFDAVAKLQDVGRGAGLRLWMFAQSLGQMHKAFGSERYKGIVEGCVVRCFMNPDQEAAAMLTPVLGESTRLFAKKSSPLASVSELMGPAYGEKIVTISRANHPASLDRVYAYQTMAAKFLPPPIVRRASP